MPDIVNECSSAYSELLLVLLLLLLLLLLCIRLPLISFRRGVVKLIFSLLLLCDKSLGKSVVSFGLILQLLFTVDAFCLVA